MSLKGTTKHHDGHIGQDISSLNTKRNTLQGFDSRGRSWTHTMLLKVTTIHQNVLFCVFISSKTFMNEHDLPID